MPETEIGLKVYVTTHNSPFLSLRVGEFGTFYPNTKNNNKHFYFAHLNQIQIKDFSSDGRLLIQITHFIVVFGDLEDEECPHPYFTHMIPIIV